MDLADKRPQEIEENRIVLVETYKSVFSSEAGRTVLYDLIRSCGVFDSSFNSNSLKMAYNEGRRSAVLSLLSKLDSDVETMRRVIREAYDMDL